MQILPYAMARPGGVQRHVRDLTDWLTAAGHPTRIVAPPEPNRAPRHCAPLHEIGRARRLAVHGTAFEISLAAPWATRRLARALHAWGAEIVHLHTPWTPFITGQMWRALRLPTVTTIHATLPDSDGADLIDRYIRRSARRYLSHSQALVTPSPAPLPLLQQLLPGLAAHIIPPAIDLSPLAPEPKTGTELLYLGRLEPRKGIDVLIAAWPRIAAACPKARLTVAGGGPLAARVQATPGMRHHPAPTDRDRVRLLAQADLLLAPAPFGESYGLVLAEAMAAGALPVAAANPGFRHVLRDLPDLLVPPCDSDALAQKVISLLKDPKHRATLRQKACTAALDSDVATQGPAYLDLYRSIIARKPAPSSRP